jgi:PLP dependent protein
LFDVIQSVDTYNIASEINKYASEENRCIDILIQVNAAKERQKFGVFPEELDCLFEKVTKFNNLSVVGLMTVAPYAKEENAVRSCFRILKRQFDRLNRDFLGSGKAMKFLSMGMTEDYHLAVEEGANMIRIGRAIFSDD